MSKLLSLDLSTSSTGWAIFDIDTKLPTSYGTLKPQVKGHSKMKYPEAAYHRVTSIADQINTLVLTAKPDEIIIEEVNRGINRITQKSLDALHFFVLDYLHFLNPTWLTKVIWQDSNGRTGWRGKLGLKLSEEDKEHNKQARAFNNSKKRRKDKKPKMPIVDWKKLAERYVSKQYGLNFNVWMNPSDSDIVDAICVGAAYFS